MKLSYRKISVKNVPDSIFKDAASSVYDGRRTKRYEFEIGYSSKILQLFMFTIKNSTKKALYIINRNTEEIDCFYFNTVHYNKDLSTKELIKRVSEISQSLK